jgi:hypothetical protein
MKKLLFITLILMINSTFAAPEVKIDGLKENEKAYEVSPGIYHVYEKPTWFGWFWNYFHSNKEFVKKSFARDNWHNLGLIATSTYVTAKYDQEILDETQRFGRSIGLTNDDNTYAALSAGETSIVRIPSDFGSMLYFLGDGWTQFGIMGAFGLYGHYQQDYRALSVASQLTEGLLTTALMTQLFKRTTGRESPFRSTRDGGKWQWLPNQNEFNNDGSKYDAFHSGHITTVTMMWTIMIENYPEYTYLKPLGATIISLLAVQMMNNGVHWASDYPLAVGMGYLFGQIAVSNHMRKVDKSKGREVSSYYVAPMLHRQGNGMQVVWDF